MDYKAILTKLLRRRDLTSDEASEAIDAILAGELSEVQIAAFLAAMSTKGETIEELAGAARAMRRRAIRVQPVGQIVVDTCGTGGDSSGTFNVSTTTAFVVAGAGVAVAKHGNRSVSSRCGSADVLEHLGVNIDAEPEVMEQALNEIGIAFLFAPRYHSAMRHAAPVRKALGVRTIFNLLGPLTNPASAPNILMGVFHPDLVGIQVHVMQRLGANHVLVVHGKDGMDEISLGAPTLVGELKNGKVSEYEVSPAEFDIAPASTETLRVADADESKSMLLTALDNQPGAARDIVILNAGAALYAANAADSITAGIVKAREVIASGSARAKVDAFVQFTQKSC